jgi:hypothetical protein
MRRLGVGFVLQANSEFLSQTKTIVESLADYYEISPETTWRPGLCPNEFGTLFREMRRKPFVAHGLDFSPGTPLDEPRVEPWLKQIREDHAAFNFQWYSEHLGYAHTRRHISMLPLPLPHTDEAIDAVVARMSKIREIVPDVLIENQASTYMLSDPRTEPEFLNRIADRGIGLLLDLHNAYTQCVNHKMDLNEWLGRIRADAVIELHLSGGSESEPEWLDSRRVFRLDSHDSAVPEPVWRAYEKHLPRFRNVRGVTLERLDGTVHSPGDLVAEFERAKDVYARTA